MKTSKTEIKAYEDEIADELLCVDIRGITTGARLVSLYGGEVEINFRMSRTDMEALRDALTEALDSKGGET